MSTFFEKLTGSRERERSYDAEEEPEPVIRSAGYQKRDPVREANAPAARHMKIASEEAAPEARLAEEEEGELTVDIYDKDDSIIIQSTVAGVRPEDIDVSVTNDTVTLRGKRDRFEAVEDKHYYYKELFWGAFSRSIILPEEVDEELAEAALKHGLLTIKLPKRRRGLVQKIKIKSV